MALKFNKQNLLSFCEECTSANLTYHRQRSQLWERFTKLQKEGKQENKDEAFVMDFALFNSIKSALTSRSDEMNDAKKLAFDTAVQGIYQQLLDDAVADDDAEGDEEKAPAPRRPPAVKKEEQ